MKFIAKLIKRIVLAFTYIYSFNILVSTFSLNIAVNQYSVGVVSLTGIPGVISLVIMKYLIK